MSSDDFGIVGWQKNSFIDFPGMISTVLFFRGCNLRCPYCHNPDIVHNQLPAVSFGEVIAFLEKRSGIIDGVVLSGGEATLNDKLPMISEQLRNCGPVIKLDTNGLRPEMIEKCKPDYLALDIKADPHDYDQLGYHGSDAFEKLTQSIDIAKSMGKNAEVRITIAPSFINDQSVKHLAELLVDFPLVYLQQMVLTSNLLDNSYAEQNVYSLEMLESFRLIFLKKVKDCRIRK